MDYICVCNTSLASHELRSNYKDIQNDRKDKENKLKKRYLQQGANVSEMNMSESEKDKLYTKHYETYKTQIHKLNIQVSKKLEKLYRFHGIGKFDWCCKMRLQTQISILDTHI